MKNKKRRPKGMLPKKRRMYQNGGGVGDPVRDRDEAIAFANLLAAERERLDNGGGVGDPPQGTITAQEALMRALQPENQFRLRGGDAPFRTIREEKDRMAAEGTDEAMFEFIRMFPVLGDAIDLVEAGKVNLTGKDLSGRETDKGLYNTFAAAGLVIPNVLERPLKFLLRKGARSEDDIFRLIYQNRRAAELAPLEELQQKAQAFERRLIEGANPTRDALRGSNIDSYTSASPERGAKNWMLENDPDLLMQFTPEAYDQGMFDRRMQEFGDQYLTMYRGVDADNPEQAARYMTEVQKGGNIGGQNAGPGIYGTSEAGLAEGYGGYRGTVRTAPDVAQSFDPADRVISDLVRLETEGAMYLPIKERQLLSDLGAFPGMETRSDRVRVVRSLPASQQKVLDISSPGEEFVPKYKSDFAGSNVSMVPMVDQVRGFETSLERFFPLIEGYQNGGKVDGDPPQGTITAQEALMRALQPDNQFRLTGGDAPFRPIKEQRDPVETLGKGIAEVVRMLPFAGEVIDTYELGKVAATGEDVYGQEQDPGLFAALTAAGYVIPNVLEKPLKSAWRAVKQFPSKMPKKEFRELMGPEKEQARRNLIQAHNEVYDPGLIPVNVRQLPSLMSGSKLENAVGKDGMIQVSQIENLINSKDISAAEKEALQDALFRTRSRAGYALGLEPGSPLPDKIDYLNFKRAGSEVVSTRRGDATFFVDESKEHADYGLDELNLDVAGKGRYSAGLYLPDIKEKARTNLIRTSDPELQSTEYGHFGRDVIGHYRTFERPDEKGVLYISELQADPLQARGSAGEKRVGLNVIPSIREDEVAGQISAIDRSIQEVYDLAERVSTMTYEELELFRSKKTGPGGNYSLEAERALPSLKDIKKDLVDNTSGGLGQGQPLLAGDFRRRDTAIEELKTMMGSLKKAKEALEGGYRGGPNPKQANLIKNQDQFLISHILEQEAKGADKLRFPTGETTAKIQSYGDQTRRISRAREGVNQYEASVKAARENELVDKAIKEHPMFKGKSEDEVFEIWNTKLGSEDYNQQYARGFDEIGDSDFNMRRAFNEWASETSSLKGQREHLSRINASEQATQGIMKGYDRLPKALKKHGLDATKVTDDVGNTWWEVDIPARLGEGVGEIRAYKKGGKFRILKK